MSDRQDARSGSLAAAGRRPHALPRRPWRVAEQWRDLLFAHWPIPPEEIAALLPSGLQVDKFDGSAWLGVIPFSMERIQLRGLPRIPGASRFPELILRTYVREENTNRAGVYFFSLEAANPLAVVAARMVFHLPYHWASMSVSSQGDRELIYESRRCLTAKPARFRARYRGLGTARVVERSQPGTIEYFLAERYYLFTRDRRGRLLRGDIDQQSWPIETAEAEIERNDLPAACGIHLPNVPPLLHYSRELVVYLWTPELVTRSALHVLEAAAARPAEI